MGEETHDDRALGGAKTAIGTSYVPTLGWADYYFSALGGVHRMGCIRREHDDDGSAVYVR
jgi:hypothetical protein